MSTFFLDNWEGREGDVLMTDFMYVVEFGRLYEGMFGKRSICLNKSFGKSIC